jgi:hypothetical protein
LAPQNVDLVAQGEDLGVALIPGQGQQADAGEHLTPAPRQRPQHRRDAT